MGKGKTSGSGYVNGNVNQNGGRVEAGGKVSHTTQGGTNVHVEGNVHRDQPFKGKGQNGGSITIVVSKDI